MKSTIETKVKPFLRWAGGKQWLADKLVKLIPEYDLTYFEPFLGGGSLFFADQPKRAVLGDINKQLIKTYQVVRDCVDDLINILSQWKNDEKTYYDIRAENFEDDLCQAAQFIFLNKTSWNGLYRVNQQGKYNVPFGYNNRKVFEELNLRETSRILQKAKIIHGDFQELLKTAAAGDFIYLDPPYTVLHSNNGFRRYNEKIFNWQDQVRLASLARDLSKKGCLVVVSNASSTEVLDLYPDFLLQKISRYCVLAANPKRRQRTEEALLVSSDKLLIFQE